MLVKILNNYLITRAKFILGRFLYKYTKRKISFSQCGEDLVIENIFNSNNKTNIFYVDIGANHPVYLSNTYKFYLKNRSMNNEISGILIEPNPKIAKLLKFIRPNDIVMNVGVVKTSESESILPFYILDQDVLSTFSENELNEYLKMGCRLVDTINVNCSDINNILDKTKKNIDLLTIDIEGVDFDVIKSLNFEKFSPTVICIETVKHRKISELKRDVELINYVKSKGYMLFSQNFVNSIFVKSNYLEKIV